MSPGFFLPMTLYFLVGMGTGFANIPTMVLISHWFRSISAARPPG